MATRYAYPYGKLHDPDDPDGPHSEGLHDGDLKRPNLPRYRVEETEVYTYSFQPGLGPQFYVFGNVWYKHKEKVDPRYRVDGVDVYPYADLGKGPAFFLRDTDRPEPPEPPPHAPSFPDDG